MISRYESVRSKIYEQSISYLPCLTVVGSLNNLKRDGLLLIV